MAAFSNDFFEKREVGGINMYIIPVGTTLYRGDSKFTDITHPELLKGDYKFFTPDAEYADKYGIVFEFKTKNELQLVAMDDISEQFFTNAPAEIQNILENNYGYSSHKRDSVEEKDYKVSQYICEQRYQGYAANTMESFDDDLNAEVIICNAEEHVERIRRVTEESKIQFKLDELRMRRTERERIESRKKVRRYTDDQDKPSGNLFGDDDDDEDGSFGGGSLFGGKTKKSTKTKKSKKQSKKKKAKTQKKRKSKKSKPSKK